MRYAKITAQDQLTEIFHNIFLLRGSIRIGPCLQMNRNMVIVRQEQDLILINAVRLNAENKKRLDRLGQVKHLIRLGDFHGLDDQYYIDHYEATLWSQKNHITYPNLIAS